MIERNKSELWGENLELQEENPSYFYKIIPLLKYVWYFQIPSGFKVNILCDLHFTVLDTCSMFFKFDQ